MEFREIHVKKVTESAKAEKMGAALQRRQKSAK
jgi:hypothetical protein